MGYIHNPETGLPVYSVDIWAGSSMNIELSQWLVLSAYIAAASDDPPPRVWEYGCELSLPDSMLGPMLWPTGRVVSLCSKHMQPLAQIKHLRLRPRARWPQVILDFPAQRLRLQQSEAKPNISDVD